MLKRGLLFFISSDVVGVLRWHFLLRYYLLAGKYAFGSKRETCRKFQYLYHFNHNHFWQRLVRQKTYTAKFKKPCASTKCRCYKYNRKCKRKTMKVLSHFYWNRNPTRLLPPNAGHLPPSYLVSRFVCLADPKSDKGYRVSDYWTVNFNCSSSHFYRCNLALISRKIQLTIHTSALK